MNFRGDISGDGKECWMQYMQKGNDEKFYKESPYYLTSLREADKDKISDNQTKVTIIRDDLFKGQYKVRPVYLDEEKKTMKVVIEMLEFKIIQFDQD